MRRKAFRTEALGRLPSGRFSLCAPAVACGTRVPLRTFHFISATGLVPFHHSSPPWRIPRQRTPIRPRAGPSCKGCNLYKREKICSAGRAIDFTSPPIISPSPLERACSRASEEKERALRRDFMVTSSLAGLRGG